MAAGPAAFAALVASSSALAAPYRTVTVEGAEFVSEDSMLQACAIRAGVDYSPAQLAEAEACLMSSDRFTSARVTPRGDELVVQVRELDNRPGTLRFGLGYDSEDGAFASVLMERYNLFAGTFGGFEARVSRDVKSVDTYLYAPGVFGEWGVGFDGGLRHVDDRDVGYTHERLFFEPYLARQLTSDLRTEIGLGYRFDRISDIAPGLSALAGDVPRKEDAPYLRLSLDYDRKAEGGMPDMMGRLDLRLLDAASSDRTTELTGTAEARFALGQDWGLRLGVNGGLVTTSGDRRIRPTDLFHVGGSDFRGFASRGVGPSKDGWFMGATRYAIGTVEVERSVGEVLGRGAKVAVFTDFGSAWGSQYPQVDGKREMRRTVGMSMTFDVGGVPVSAYVAKAAEKEATDKRQTFGLSISHRF